MKSSDHWFEPLMPAFERMIEDAIIAECGAKMGNKLIARAAGRAAASIRDAIENMDNGLLGIRGVALRVADETACLSPRLLKDAKKVTVLKAILDADGNRKVAAERIGMGLRTMYRRSAEYGIRGGPGQHGSVVDQARKALRELSENDA